MASRRDLLLQAKHCLALAAVVDPVELAVENDSAPYWIDESLFATTPNATGSRSDASSPPPLGASASDAVSATRNSDSIASCSCGCPSLVSVAAAGVDGDRKFSAQTASSPGPSPRESAPWSATPTPSSAI